MPRRRRHPEDLPFRISLEAANRTVGLIALALPFALLGITAAGFGCPQIDSISHYYYVPLGGDVFTAALAVIGAVMLFFYALPRAPDGRVIDVAHYEGHALRDFRAARVAGLMAFVVALVPTTDVGCEAIAGKTARAFLVDTALDGDSLTGTPSFDFFAAIGRDPGLLAWLHYGAAAVMFAVLAWFCLVVCARVPTADPQRRPQKVPRLSVKWWRNALYYLSGCAILGAMAALGSRVAVTDSFGLSDADWNARNLTFWCESAALWAFGVSWSIKGRIFAFLRDPGEGNPRAEAVQARAA